MKKIFIQWIKEQLRTRKWFTLSQLWLFIKFHKNFVIFTFLSYRISKFIIFDWLWRMTFCSSISVSSTRKTYYYSVLNVCPENTQKISKTSTYLHFSQIHWKSHWKSRFCQILETDYKFAYDLDRPCTWITGVLPSEVLSDTPLGTTLTYVYDVWTVYTRLLNEMVLLSLMK